MAASKEKRRRLAVFASGKKSAAFDAKPPAPTEVVYAPANKDGSKKTCGNCLLWQRSAQSCQILEPDVVVPEDAICNYHVADKLSPELAGFDQSAGGTACYKCKHYDAIDRESGKCEAVMDPESEGPALVDALGCCSRWDEK